MPRRDRGGDPYRLEMNLTPLLDVVLQLITFFMMLVHFGTQIETADREVRLPVAPAALVGAAVGEDALVVTIDPAGDLIVGDEALGLVEAEDWWRGQAIRRFRGLASIGQEADELTTRVIVRADREAPYGAVRTAMATAQDYGFARFSLVVRRREEEP